MGDWNVDNVKQSFSGFCSKYMVETVTLVAIVLGAVSSWLNLFIGSWGWSILFLVVGCGLGLLMPSKMDKMIKKIYSFSCGSNQTTIWMAQGAKMAVALFLPFAYFWFLGVMAGTAYEYYIHTARSQDKGKKGNKVA